MDTLLPNGTRYRYNYMWESRKNLPYNYEANGLLNKIMSKGIVYSKNKPLQLMLNFYEQSLIFLMKYVDRLKYFKNPHWTNR